MSKYINEAFKAYRLLESEDFEMTPEGFDNLGSFMNQAIEDEAVDVIDLEAEADEELKKSYVGKVICDCNVCHSNIFYNKEDIEIDEGGVVNIDDECPYCMSMDGYTIVGEIQPYDEEDSEEIQSDDTPDLDVEPDDELAEEPIEIEDDEELEEALQLSGRKELKGKSTLRHSDKFEGDKRIRGKNNTKLSGDLDLHEAKEKDTRVFAISSNVDGEICKVESEKEAKDTIAELKREDKKDKSRKNSSIKYSYKLVESIENVSIDTDDETMTMTTKDDGGVVIETSPRDDIGMEDSFGDDFEMSDDLESGDEMIAPLSDETEEEIGLEEPIELEDDDFNFEEPVDDVPAEDEEDVDVDEFDEETFDGLGESYLRRCYDNVKGFKTTQVRCNENLLKVIGNITFKSGNTKKTSFVFESKSTKNGKYLFEGYNTEINKGKKAFKLNCSIKNKTIIPESMSYNYRSKNALNESVKISGVVKARRK